MQRQIRTCFRTFHYSSLSRCAVTRALSHVDDSTFTDAKPGPNVQCSAETGTTYIQQGGSVSGGSRRLSTAATAASEIS